MLVSTNGGRRGSLIIPGYACDRLEFMWCLRRLEACKGTMGRLSFRHEAFDFVWNRTELACGSSSFLSSSERDSELEARKYFENED